MHLSKQAATEAYDQQPKSRFYKTPTIKKESFFGIQAQGIIAGIHFLQWA